jgi:hypothetical protein
LNHSLLREYKITAPLVSACSSKGINRARA